MAQLVKARLVQGLLIQPILQNGFDRAVLRTGLGQCPGSGSFHAGLPITLFEADLSLSGAQVIQHPVGRSARAGRVTLVELCFQPGTD